MTYEAIDSEVQALRLTGPLFTRAMDRFDALWAGMAAQLIATVGRRWGEHGREWPDLDRIA